MIYITEKASKKIEEISNNEGIGHYIVRVSVIGGGCAGMTNDMNFDDRINQMDEITEFDYIKVVIDPVSFQYLDGTTIDYDENVIGGGFRFLNPNVKSSCGCGHSQSY